MNPQVQRLVFATVTILGFAALAAALLPDNSIAEGQKSVDSTTALEIGLKDPATTVALLKTNAVVDLKADVDASNRITRLGVACALCHSTVDGSVMPGIGKRLDGWPNLSLDFGKIISLDVKHSPDLVTAKLPALRAYQDSLTVRTSALSAVPPRQQRADAR